MRVAALAMLAVTLCARGAPAAKNEAAPAPYVRVIVLNYAGVDHGLLRAAEQETNRILAAAGIETRWAECWPRAEAACARPVLRDTMTLTLLPEKMARVFRQRDTVFGYSFPCVNSEATCHAYVFYERVADRDEHTMTHAALLGHVAAHELAHLLLHTQDHSTAGIMTGRWSDEELRQGAMGRLRFSDAEAKALRAELLQRDLAAGALVAAGSQ